MKRAVFHPEAETELIAAANWYDQQSPGLGAAFLDEAEAAISRIVAHPETFAIVARGVRRHLLDRFPFGVLYRLESDRIYILAVMHLHREPHYWERRM